MGRNKNMDQGYPAAKLPGEAAGKLIQTYYDEIYQPDLPSDQRQAAKRT